MAVEFSDRETHGGTMRNKILLWSLLLIGGFLSGFIPEYSKSHRLAHIAAEASGQLEQCQSSEQVSQLRDTAALMYLEATRKNYGTSAAYAARFFDQAQQLMSSTKDEALRGVLRELLAKRDQVTADLAKGDAGVISEMQPILSKVEPEAKR